MQVGNNAVELFKLFTHNRTRDIGNTVLRTAENRLAATVELVAEECDSRTVVINQTTLKNSFSVCDKCTAFACGKHLIIIEAESTCITDAAEKFTAESAAD